MTGALTPQLSDILQPVAGVSIAVLASLSKGAQRHGQADFSSRLS